MTPHTTGTRRPGEEQDDAQDAAPLVDVVVIGGGAAGLAAATSLARFRYRVLVVDAGQPRNAPAHGVHNVLGHDGLPPAQLLATARRDLAAYGAHVLHATVAAVRPAPDPAAPAMELTGGSEPLAASTTAPRFVVQLVDGGEVHARRVVVASGLVDELPAVAGLSQRWGREVLHCPFCHGWEVRDQRVVVLATEARGLHAVLLWRQLTEHLTVVLAVGVEPSEQQWEQFAARGIGVVDGGASAQVLVVDDRVIGLRLSSGHVVDCDALAVTTTMHARVDFLAPLGLVPTEVRMGGAVVGTKVETSAMGATSVPGVYVTGNAEDLFAQVATSVAAALTTAAAVNGSLVHEDTAAAVRVHVRRAEAVQASPASAAEDPFSAAMEAKVCERVLQDRRHGL